MRVPGYGANNFVSLESLYGSLVNMTLSLGMVFVYLEIGVTTCLEAILKHINAVCIPIYVSMNQCNYPSTHCQGRDWNQTVLAHTSRCTSSW